MEERGFEPDKCSRSKRASLDSIAASRAFSLLSCFIRCSCWILRCSTPGSRRQLSIDSHNRHRGNDEPDAPLTGELEGGAGGAEPVLPPSLAQILERVGPAPKPEGIKASIIVRPYSRVGRATQAHHMWCAEPPQAGRAREHNRSLHRPPFSSSRFIRTGGAECGAE